MQPRFEYPCLECGRGTMRTTRVPHYQTKINGIPFVVDEAVIGVCDQCGAIDFDPQETKRWEALFHRRCCSFLLPVPSLGSRAGKEVTVHTILVADLAGRHCLLSEEGEALCQVISRLLEQGNTILLDFSGVETLTAMFLNAALGPLYRRCDASGLDARLHWSGLDPQDARILEIVIENARAPFATAVPTSTQSGRGLSREE